MSKSPLKLIVPGIDNSGPDHWQSLWEQQDSHMHRVDLSDWHQPQRQKWVDRLDETIRHIRQPAILIAHSLGCHAIAHWASGRPHAAQKIAGAFLVAPPDVDTSPADERLTGFAPAYNRRLPFPSLLIASRNDPYAAFGQSKRLARLWGSRLINAGALGHINAQSLIGDWPYGKFLLNNFVEETFKNSSIQAGSSRLAA